MPSRRAFAASLACLPAAVAAGARFTATEPGPMRPSDPRHDFDFLHGRWHVRNERLRVRLAGAQDWEVFEAVNDCRPLLGGAGNVDAFDTGWSPDGRTGGYHGMTVRLYEPSRRRWSIRWASDRTGLLEPPVHGRFRDGVGTFFGDDVHAGRPVRVRFVWNGIGATTATWQQAFSADGGATWETNWLMRMTRMPAAGAGEAA